MSHTPGHVKKAAKAVSKYTLGQSFRTSLAGISTFAILAVEVLRVYLPDHPVPTDHNDYFRWAVELAVAIGLRLAKDANVSHATIPKEPPKTVGELEES